jgi:hypothetical protein
MQKLPAFLVLVSCAAVAAIAIVDATYRKDFISLANTMVVGFWAWLQAPPRPESK